MCFHVDHFLLSYKIKLLSFIICIFKKKNQIPVFAEPDMDHRSWEHQLRTTETADWVTAVCGQIKCVCVCVSAFISVAGSFSVNLLYLSRTHWCGVKYCHVWGAVVRNVYKYTAFYINIYIYCMYIYICQIQVMVCLTLSHRKFKPLFIICTVYFSIINILYIKHTAELTWM